ncbi:hypothetical protein BN970_05073 [Mycolicibacterium conceptionense]|uniref:Uncharacterized protein n=1 Tax=Mycolicibacterium conceptionense TaxID=451644 RepID=A0A0U1DRP8_9MYCO|nr:hypothetical protein [Mycolicibacterium conceptionense]CQD21628.1 hypothetical protein BN970_05073 [Mycolicibacterium conceptionense]
MTANQLSPWMARIPDEQRDAVRQAVKKAPPLTAQQITRIARIMRGSGNGQSETAA